MFTYDSYIELLNIGIELKHNFFVRHDVDISLKKAVQMAEIEHQNNIRSTYYILLSSPFYNALEAENLERIRMLIEFGMDVGLHYDPSIKTDMTDKDMKNEILVQLGLLQHHIGSMPMSVTFHKPVMGTPVNLEVIRLLDAENIYCPNYDSRFKYISDSGHNWREDPLEVIKITNNIHVNIHPEWYNDEEKSMEECLLNLGLDIQSDKLILKEIKEIQEYLKRIETNRR